MEPSVEGILTVCLNSSTLLNKMATIPIYGKKQQHKKKKKKKKKKQQKKKKKNNNQKKKKQNKKKTFKNLLLQKQENFKPVSWYITFGT